MDRKTVYNVARRAGLPNRHRFDPERTKRILGAYEAGEPVKAIVECEGVSPSFVRTVARRAGLSPRRDWRRRYPLDEGAFEKPDAVGWWLIGLIAADGSIQRERNEISLTQREADSDVLHAFFEYVGCPGRPLIELRLSEEAQLRTHVRSRAFSARIYSKRICETLATHGITPRKSKTLELGDEAADEPAVWLGLLDGDGCVSRIGQRGRPRIDFYGTPRVMRQCSSYWSARLSFQRVKAPTVSAHAGGLGRVALHGANAARAAGILLAASPVSLQRKRRSLEAIAAHAPERVRQTP